MRLFIAAILAMGTAFLWDRLLFLCRVNTVFRVALAVPVGEELIKFGSAIFFNLTPPLLYGLFGLGEGLYETMVKKRFIPRLVWAGTLTHTAFSTFFMLGLQVWLSLLLAMFSHAIWNYVLYKNDCNNSSI